MIRLRIEAKYPGPTLLEMAPLLEGGTEAFEVRWEHSRQEIRLLESFRHRDVTLVVPDLPAMERASAIISTRLAFEVEVKRNALSALNDRGANWRDFAGKVGLGVARGLMINIAADTIAKGRNPVPFRAVLNDCLFENVSTLDADVLLGLRASF